MKNLIISIWGVLVFFVFAFGESNRIAINISSKSKINNFFCYACVDKTIKFVSVNFLGSKRKISHAEERAKEIFKEIYGKKVNNIKCFYKNIPKIKLNEILKCSDDKK